MPAWRAQLGAAALVLGLGSAPIAAQSVNDYRLPGATSTPAPSGAQGPVDAAEPAVRQSVATPSPSPQPSPAATQTPPARTAPSPVPSAAPRARPSTQVAAPLPQPQPQPQPQPSATLAAPLPQASPSVAPPPTVLPTAPGSSSTPLIPETLWPWLAAALALAAAGFAALWWRSRKARPAVVEFERPVPTQAPAPQPASPPTPTATPSSAPAIEIVLEAQRLTASLMATTLTYRLRLTNRGDQALTTLAIEGDMVSAHASLPPDQQIASPAQRLELRHAAVDLAPGASTEFSGDLRLALTAITPIRAGDGAYFVPLARLRVEASTPAGETQLTVQTFVIGELAENPGAPLRPFRLDQGPRTYARLGQRVVD